MQMELSLDELRNLIKSGSEIQLMEDYLQNGRVYIGRERVLLLKDIDRFEGKVYGKLKVREKTKLVTVDDNTKKTIQDEVEKIFKDDPFLKGMLYAKKKKVKQIVINFLPHNDYILVYLNKMLRHSRKLFNHSIMIGIQTLILDVAWQERFNQGLVDSLRFENLWYGAILHDIGLLKLDKSFSEKKLLETESLEDYMTHPEVGYQLLLQEQKVSELHPDVLRMVYEHEENLDGSGYPMRLVSDNILPLSQMISVVEEFNNLLSGELTQEVRPFEQVIRRLMAQQTKYDKKLINVLFEQFRYLE